jgi:hypothetical protein
MYDANLREEIDKCVKVITTITECCGKPFPTDNYDLVLDIVETEDKTIRQYYFVDHKNRTLFWPHYYDMEPLLNEVLGVKEPGHISKRFSVQRSCSSH